MGVWGAVQISGLVASILKGWDLNAGNTGLSGVGVDPASLAVYSGANPIPTGTTVFQRKFTSRPDLSNGGVTLDQCWIAPASGAGDILTMYTGTVVKDCDIDGSAIAASTIAYNFAVRSTSSPFTLQHCRIFGMGSGIWPDTTTGTTNIEHNFIHNLVGFGDPATTGSHNDGITRRENTGQVNLRFNRIDSTTVNNTTGDVFIQSASGTTINNTMVEGNLFDLAGNYNLILEARDGGSIGNNMRSINNRFNGSPGYVNALGGSASPVWAQWNNNYVYDAGAADAQGALIPDPS